MLSREYFSGMKLTRAHKIILKAQECLNELVEKGFMDGPIYELSGDALESIEDFECTQDELNLAAEVLIQKFNEQSERHFSTH